MRPRSQIQALRKRLDIAPAPSSYAIVPYNRHPPPLPPIPQPQVARAPMPPPQPVAVVAPVVVPPLLLTPPSSPTPSEGGGCCSLLLDLPCLFYEGVRAILCCEPNERHGRAGQVQVAADPANSAAGRAERYAIDARPNGTQLQKIAPVPPLPPPAGVYQAAPANGYGGGTYAYGGTGVYGADGNGNAYGRGGSTHLYAGGG